MKARFIDRSILRDRIYQNTYDALRRLVDNSYYSQLTSVGYDCNSLSYLKELCTIKMSTSRGSGHTMASCKLAWEYFDKVLFLSPTIEMSKRINEYLRKLEPNNGASRRITKDVIETSDGYYCFGSYSNMNESKYRGMDFESIIVDGTFAFKPSVEMKIYDLYVTMSKNPQRFFIFIQ